MIRWRIDVLSVLKHAGYTQYTIRKERIFSSGLLDAFRRGDTNMSLQTIDKLCKLLECEVEDLIEYVDE